MTDATDPNELIAELLGCHGDELGLHLVAGVPEQLRRLRVGLTGIDCIDLAFQVAIGLQQIEASVEVTNLPERYEISGVEPASVEVTVRGPRRDLLLARRAGLGVDTDTRAGPAGNRLRALGGAASLGNRDQVRR